MSLTHFYSNRPVSSSSRLSSLHALHGFLGTPTDWSFFNIEHLITYDLFNDVPITPFDEWAVMFNKQVDAAPKANNILLGYSLGGRLALHAVLNEPKKWKAAIFVSTHPGLKCDKEKEHRINADKLWSERFQNMPWDALMCAWNAQDVFKDDLTILNRKESDYNRQSLSKALNTWSVGIQADLTHAIATLDIPILWIVGENDKKFVKVAQELQFKHQKSKLDIVSNSGHRLLFEQQEIFSLTVKQFIQNLETNDDRSNINSRMDEHKNI